MAYTKTTDFASKDSLLTGDPAKVVKGSEIDAEFDNIEAAIGTTTGSGAVVLATAPTLTTPTLGNASGDSVTITAATIACTNGLNFDSNTFVIDATNNRVGIGTSSPGEKLHVYGNAVDTAAKITKNGTDSIQVGVDSEAYLAAGGVIALRTGGFTSAYDKAKLDASGNFLVGVSSATTNGGKIETSNGITFPATQSACSNANTLDDYEEGNHTPTVTASGGGTITLNTSADTLTYTKKGREVTVKGNIWFNEAAPSFTGAIRLTLPFTAANATDAGNTVCGSVVFNGINGDPNGFSVIINDSGTYMTVDRMLTTAASGNFAGDAATFILPIGGGELSMLYLNITYDAA